MNTAPAQTTIVRLAEERNLDRQIDICRKGAIRDRVRVIIERPTKRGTKIPVLEITPQGDIREVPAPALKTPIRLLVKHVMTDETLLPNRAALDGYARLSTLVAEVDRRIATKRGRNQARRDRQSKKVAVAVVQPA